MPQKEKKPNSGRGKLFFRATCLLVFFLAVVQIGVANRLATKGEVVEKFEVEAGWLKEENQKIENEIINLSSLGQIASRSGKLAFRQEATVVYLPRPVIVALKEE